MNTIISNYLYYTTIIDLWYIYIILGKLIVIHIYEHYNT